MLSIKCKECGTTIKIFPSRRGQKYCSYKCRSKNSPNIFKKGTKRPFITGPLNPKWRGGRVLHEKGYIYIYSPYHPNKGVRGYVLEHRLIIEKNLGRFLKKTEVVHHKNAIKNDNRIENLQLFSSSSEHGKHEYRTNKKFRDAVKRGQFKKLL